eukprot:12249211-Karenia_brevis.AAC.1
MRLFGVSPFQRWHGTARVKLLCLRLCRDRPFKAACTARGGAVLCGWTCWLKTIFDVIAEAAKARLSLLAHPLQGSRKFRGGP